MSGMKFFYPLINIRRVGILLAHQTAHALSALLDEQKALLLLEREMFHLTSLSNRLSFRRHPPGEVFRSALVINYLWLLSDPKGQLITKVSPRRASQKRLEARRFTF